jgi:O-antigen ligase
MRESALITSLILACVFVLFVFILITRPGYLANPVTLGTLIVGQIVIVSLCKYRKLFFLLLMVAFLWAGMHVPLSSAWLQGRWIVLAVGALGGLLVYLRGRAHHFGFIHFVALFCVLSAVVSASVSSYPQEALLKSLSLFLLFLYGAMGARLAVTANEEHKFFDKLLVVCEAISYLAVLAYFGFHYAVFGNPNSLGAVMGVVVVPVMFWGLLRAETTPARTRLALELCLAAALLMSSFSRAGIAAAAVSCFLVAFALKRYRVIITGVAASLLIAVLTVNFVPREQDFLPDAPQESVASLFLYKGKPAQGLLGSRKGPWEQTVSAIKAHPWFGTGFGTSVSDRSAAFFELTRSQFIDSRMIREHGNSYLAILEWSGLLGVAPFYLLALSVAVKAGKSLVWLRRAGTVSSPLVPAAAIIIAGLIGAAFEDWLFAVGYYLCVFFWSLAFILADLVGTPANHAPPLVTTFAATPQYAGLAGDSCASF